MHVRIVTLASIRHAAAFEEFVTRVRVSAAEHGGKFIGDGIVDHCYWNEINCPPVDRISIIEFKSGEDADAWLNSTAYQSLLPVRQAAMDVTVLRAVSFHDNEG